MKFTVAIITITTQISSSIAFVQPNSPFKHVSTTVFSSIIDGEATQPLFDPLGLYPEGAPERTEGLLQPLETTTISDKTIKDPLGLYNDKSVIDESPMSASLPFLKRPIMLDGTLPGDRGFDPFNFSNDANALQWYRTAEIKHARLAMLAAVGWPLAELFDRKLAFMFNLRPLLVYQDRVPSVLNGGLDRTPAIYWAAALGVAFAIESISFINE